MGRPGLRFARWRESLLARRTAAAVRLQLCLDGGDALGRRGHLLRFLVGDLNVECFLDRHDELDGVQAVRAEILGEAGRRRDLARLYAQLLRDDRLDLVLDVARRDRHARRRRDTHLAAADLRHRRVEGAGGGNERGEREAVEHCGLFLILVDST
eukprot:CAMPEP_0185307894 /NCGR_PEP_ID=MMETSP1363-20130426/18046_1 /TAXON_ID=38817 /ORGANISM="Gephyrocapsa oceanica, Strain RCC1303" /LENGTH=154 /DNA_ID=CAMNT_0027905263 /DNA_START=96 /DNA_END=560 /DNA_ORIENTATION=-